MRGGRAFPAVLLGLALALGACGGGGSAPQPRTGPSPSGSAQEATARPLAAGKDAWVDVSVATVWRRPTSPRAVDAPALEDPVRVRQWLAAMSLDQRRDLAGRADTQALLGDRVRVLRLRPRWARVAVPDQPVSAPGGGYRGWVPRRQLTARPPRTSPRMVTVTVPTTWLRTPDGTRVVEVGFGTRLPYLGAAAHGATVALPSGDEAVARTGDVVVHRRGEPALAPTRRSLLRTARMFLGLGYLWAGRSGFGLDCSGLTSLDYRVHGIVIPRDAAPQSAGGTPVRRADLRRGDLVFFARGGLVHHVGLYAGRGRMVHAPGTGEQVRVTPLAASPYAEEYAGARRYLR